MLVHVLREYNVNKILLSHIGLWPFQNKFIRNFLPTLYFICETSYFLLEIITLYDHLENTEVIFETCYHIAALTMFITKLSYEFWNRDKIKCLYETMENHWNIFTNDFERNVLTDYSIISQKFSMFYSITLYFMLTISITHPFKSIFLDIIRPLNESRPRNFPVPVEWRVDRDKYFVPIFCHTTIVMMMGVIILIGTDTAYVTRTVHACSLFSIISQQLEKIIPNLVMNEKTSNCGNYYKSTREQIIYQEYIICLKKYQFALQFVNLLNSIYQPVTLILLFLICMFISLLGIRILYVNQLEQLALCCFGFIGMLLQLLILCHFGQMLIDENQNVFYRIYASEWYKFSSKLKSLLIITLHRSFIPCILTAGNIIPLSMTTFTGVLRASMSYFTTFSSLKN